MASTDSPSTGAGAPVTPMRTPGQHTGSASAGALTPMQKALQRYSGEELREYAAFIDYKDLATSAVSGVYVLPDPKDPRQWHGAVAIRGGMYKGAIYRFQLKLHAEHPQEGAYPTIHFITPVYHPLVHPISGRLQLLDRFPTWAADTRVSDAVNYAKAVLQLRSGEFDTPNPLNSEALDLWRHSRDEFSRKARASAVAVGEAQGSGADPPLARPHSPQPEEGGSAMEMALGWISEAVGGSEVEAPGPAPSSHLMDFAPPSTEAEALKEWLLTQNRTGKDIAQYLLRVRKQGTRDGAGN